MRRIWGGAQPRERAEVPPNAERKCVAAIDASNLSPTPAPASPSPRGRGQG